MKTLKLQLHFCQSYISNPALYVPLIIPIKAKSKPVCPSSPSPNSYPHLVASKSGRTTKNADRHLVLEVTSPKSNIHSTGELPVKCSSGCPKMAILGAVSLGLALFLMGFDENRALALGPEGPLMEEFWDNMRRYALYVLTVSTGALYTLLQPIAELLKNPISAILILVILGGGIFIVSQVVTAMVGLSDFSYDYSY